jgi:hypothetical protein
MPSHRQGVYITWHIFQRRTESLADQLQLEKIYCHYKWENKSKVHKIWSYFLKTVITLGKLVHFRPKLIFFQLPPTPVLYVISAYCWFTGSKCFADCHNSMICDSKWLNWPFAKALLAKADAMLVHNNDVQEFVRSEKMSAITLRDPLPSISKVYDPGVLEQYGLKQYNYVIVPWSFSPDEPIYELIQVAELMPQTKFVMTWFAEKVPLSIRESMPPNLLLTGYLNETEYNKVFAQAGAALVLTTREGTQPSGASEAITLEVPLIVSDIKTTKKLYKDMPIYVENTVEGIHRGVINALEQREECVAKIKSFAIRYRQELNAELTKVKTLLEIDR